MLIIFQDSVRYFINLSSPLLIDVIRDIFDCAEMLDIKLLFRSLTTLIF